MNELEAVAERVECASMQSLYAAAPSVGALAGVYGVGRAIAVCLDGARNEMLGRVFGLGLHEPATREGTKALLDWFRARDAGPFLVHAGPSAEPKELRAWLLEDGLRSHRAWMKFAREREVV